MKRNLNQTLWVILLLLAGVLSAKAQPVKQLNWKGFERTNLVIDGYEGYYVKPRHALAGNPWVWRSSFPDWHTEIDSILLNKGFYVAYINADDQFGSPAALQIWDKFYNQLVHQVQLAPKVALEAVSRGGLYAYGWAKRNPDKVSCIYAETPVCDFKSWPGGKGTGEYNQEEWKSLLKAYQFTEQQALAYQDNPIDNLEGLASFKVPLLHVVSMEDKLVPVKENTDILMQRYVTLGGPVTIYPMTDGPKELKGHHFPIASKATEFAQFIYQHSFPIRKILPYSAYLNIRTDLNPTFKAITQRKQITVGFLGGSITYNPGWRDKVSAWLQERFPDTKFRLIKAAIPSLGSLAHAFRLQKDLLDTGKIDLLFVEAAVNDRGSGVDSLTQLRSLEGIIRHAKKSNPEMDIVMMSFADTYKTSDYQQGRVPAEVARHEQVASHYHLNSINLAKEVAEKIANKEFSWSDDFKDIHPSVFGQELYFQNIKAMLQALFEKFDPGIKIPVFALPKTLDNWNFSAGSYLNISKARHNNQWQLIQNWSPADGLATRDGFVHVPVLNTEKPGAAFTLSFEGDAIGIAIVSGGDAGMISYSIDQKPAKRIDLYTEWSSWLHLPYYILLDSGLKKGRHTLRLEVSAQKNPSSKGTACRIVNFLLNK